MTYLADTAVAGSQTSGVTALPSGSSPGRSDWEELKIFSLSSDTVAVTEPACRSVSLHYLNFSPAKVNYSILKYFLSVKVAVCRTATDLTVRYSIFVLFLFDTIHYSRLTVDS